MSFLNNNTIYFTHFQDGPNPLRSSPSIVRVVTSGNLRERRICVYNIDAAIEEQALAEYLTKHAPVVKVALSGSNFAFVILDRMRSVDVIMEKRPHVLAGKELRIKRMPNLSDRCPPSDDSYTCVCRVQLYGLTSTLGHSQRLDNHALFGKYGRIVRVVDRHTLYNVNDVAFLVFADYDSVDRVCLKSEYIFTGRRFHVQKSSQRELAEYERNMSQATTISHQALGSLNAAAGDAANSIKPEILQDEQEPSLVLSTRAISAHQSNKVASGQSSRASSDDALLDSNNNELIYKQVQIGLKKGNFYRTIYSSLTR